MEKVGVYAWKTPLDQMAVRHRAPYAHKYFNFGAISLAKCAYRHVFEKRKEPRNIKETLTQNHLGYVEASGSTMQHFN